jgi:predicted unusual protein kinase regulating ubiquinone biosynthesis (AarF/ABC1/UbiB family)
MVLLTISLIKDMQICDSRKFHSTISKSLFVEYYYGKEAGFEEEFRKNIKTINQLLVSNVNNEGSSDISIIRVKKSKPVRLRQIVNDDEK